MFFFQGSPLSYSNNPSAPPSPTGHPGPPSLTSDAIDQNTYFINQAQAALQQDFEQFTMVRESLIFKHDWKGEWLVRSSLRRASRTKISKNIPCVVAITFRSWTSSFLTVRSEVSKKLSGIFEYRCDPFDRRIDSGPAGASSLTLKLWLTWETRERDVTKETFVSYLSLQSRSFRNFRRARSANPRCRQHSLFRIDGILLAVGT